MEEREKDVAKMGKGERLKGKRDAPCQDRTGDLQIMRLTLYQLSQRSGMPPTHPTNIQKNNKNSTKQTNYKNTQHKNTHIHTPPHTHSHDPRHKQHTIRASNTKHQRTTPPRAHSILPHTPTHTQHSAPCRRAATDKEERRASKRQHTFILASRAESSRTKKSP